MTSNWDPEKIAFWRAKVEEQQASGLTQVEFCRQNDVSVNKFSFWKGVVFPHEKVASHIKARMVRRHKSFSPYERKLLVKKWRKSGLTQAEFCKQEDIFVSQFSVWKRVVNQEEKEAATNKRSTNFVEVKLDVKKKTAALKTVSQSKNCPAEGKGVIVAEIKFSSGTILIFSDAGVVAVRNIFLALSECEHDRSE